MKSLTLLLVLLLTIQCNAQKGEISLNGGIAYNVALDRSLKHTESAFPPFIDLKYSRNTKHKLQYGASVSFTDIKRKAEINYTDVNGNPIGNGKEYAHFGYPSIGLNIYGGNRFLINKSQISAGLLVSLGYNSANVNRNPTYPYQSGKPIHIYMGSGIFYGGGFYFDFTQYLSDKLGIGFNVSSRYIQTKNSFTNLRGKTTNTYNFLVFPLTLGVHYRL